MPVTDNRGLKANLRDTPFRSKLRIWLGVGCLMIVLTRIFHDGLTGDRLFMLVALLLLGILNAPDKD
jgi:hypothetical protein